MKKTDLLDYFERKESAEKQQKNAPVRDGNVKRLMRSAVV